MEDNFVNQRVAQLLLGRLGYRCDLAADGREAVRSLRRQDYQLVLMDVQMPEMDGLEVTRLVRQELGDRPYIVALTANARSQDRDDALEAGMNDFLTKPLRALELREALERAALVIGTQA